MKKNKILFVFIILILTCFYDVKSEEKIVSEKFVLVGDYRPSSKGRLTLVLLHGLGSVRGEWNILTKILEKEGFGYFLYDLRGHGQSIKTISGKEIKFSEFKEIGLGSEWNKMVKDLDTVIKFLVSKKNVKEENIILCGASLGANICLIYASKNPKIKNMILLSPGWEYVGLKTESAAKVVSQRNVKVLFCAAKGDSYSYSSTRQLINIMQSLGEKVEFLEGKNAQHGVQMFEEDFLKRLVGWINDVSR